MDKEMEQFQKDLLKSVRQMKTGKAARKTKVALSPIAEARNRLGMSQTELAALMGVSPRTLQDWEQGRRRPGRGANLAARGDCPPRGAAGFEGSVARSRYDQPL